MPSGLLAGLAGGMQGYSQGRQKETDLAVNLTLKQLEAEADAEKEKRIAERAATIGGDGEVEQKRKIELEEVKFKHEKGLIAERAKAGKSENADTAAINKINRILAEKKLSEAQKISELQSAKVDAEKLPPEAKSLTQKYIDDELRKLQGAPPSPTQEITESKEDYDAGTKTTRKYTAPMPTGTTPSDQDLAAMEWAKANPNDPRSALIMKRLNNGI